MWFLSLAHNTVPIIFFCWSPLYPVSSNGTFKAKVSGSLKQNNVFFFEEEGTSCFEICYVTIGVAAVFKKKANLKKAE